MSFGGGYGARVQVHQDRIISTFPQCYNEDASLHTRKSFDPQAKQLCLNQQTTSIGLKICKMIVIGDMGVGKTSLVTRFCKKAFDKDYKATIGVDFEVERFEILGSPFTLQMWDTAGQERFQCIAAAYYRGAQVVTIVFDLSDMKSLGNARNWLQAALKENQGVNDIKIFLVGTKRDLLTSGAYRETEVEAVKIAKAMGAEFWATSSLSGDNVKEFFFRVAAISFESSVLKEFEKRKPGQLGDGGLVKAQTDNEPERGKQRSSCC